MNSYLRKATVTLRRIPGGVLIGEFVRKSVAHRGEQRVDISDFDGDLRISLDLSEHMQSQIYWHGSYSRNIIYLLKRIARPGMTVIDAGANVGEITLIAAKQVGPTGRVIAFEPMPAFADRLENNVALNGFQNVTVMRLGLSDAPGEAPIFVSSSSYADGTHHDGLATLFPSGGRTTSAATIPLARLDDLLSAGQTGRVDIIKMDIEGGELSALRGARSLLLRDGPSIILEVGRETCRAAGYEMEDILRLLDEFGYTYSRIGRKGRLEPISADGLGKFQNIFCVRGDR